MKNLLMVALVLSCLQLAAQSITGDWQGELNAAGTQLPLVFHVQDSAGKLTGRFDSPRQMAYGLPCSSIQVIGDSMLIAFKMLNASFEALLNSNRTMATGQWKQGGMVFPLQLQRTSTVSTGNQFNRPQTPRPPFPYKVDSVSFSSAATGIQYGGTITAPLEKVLRRYPAILLITGSGQQDRDETIFDHKPFAVIADHLTKSGYLVLRVDDRGIGKTTGKFSGATTADFARDAAAAVDYLKTLRNVDTNHIGLIGHSEGALIAAMLAASRKDISFIVQLAGPALPIKDLMRLQAAAIAKANGASADAAQQYESLYRNLVEAILKEEDATIARQRAEEQFNFWQQKTPAAAVYQTTGVNDEASAKRFITTFVTQLRQPWMKYFMSMDPASYYSTLRCPVLSIHASEDIQVVAAPNHAAVQQQLAGKVPQFKAVIVPGLNHLFQHCTRCTVDEYASIEETFDPAVLQLMDDWIKAVVSK